MVGSLSSWKRCCTVVTVMGFRTCRYHQLALRRVVWELRRLEVAPVDGLTLVDFMHSRGVNMRHLGRIVHLSREAAAREAASAIEQQAAATIAQRQQSLQPQQQQQAKPFNWTPGSMAHITMVCQMDMVSRSVKHLLRAVVSTVCNSPSASKSVEVANAVAATLNAVLGSSDAPLSAKVWEWIRTYIAKRYQHHISESECQVLQRQMLLRSICQKV